MGRWRLAFPEAGGTYVYLREIFGKRTAFVYGWMSLLVTDPGLTAMLAVGLAQYVGHLTDLGPWATQGRRGRCRSLRWRRSTLLVAHPARGSGRARCAQDRACSVFSSSGDLAWGEATGQI